MKDYSFHLPGSRQKGIMLIHGLTGSPAEMAFVGKRLHAMGFTVSCPTLAGHCQDEKALIATTFEDWVASIKNALIRFRDDVDEVYMAGICVGGQLALYAAHQMPGLVKGVTLFSPLLNYDGWNVSFYYPWARWGLPFTVRMPLINRLAFGEAPPYGIKSDRIRTAIIGKGDGIAGTLPRFPMKSLYQNYRLNTALKKILPAVTIPTLIIHAHDDDVSHPRNAHKIKNLHGGSCRIEWLDDSYHMIHVDQERQKVADLTGQFFGLPEMQAFRQQA